MMKKLGIVAALAATLVSAVSAQTLTARESKLNYSYVYGAGGNTFSGNDSLLDNALLASDFEALDYTGNTSGSLSGIPYTAGVSGSLSHAYTVFGAPASFTGIQVEQGSTGTAESTGAAVATFQSSPPGNQLILEFTLATSKDYSLSGFVSCDPQNVGVFNAVALQSWDGVTWQHVYHSGLLGSPNVTINETGTIGPGLYRMLSITTLTAFMNESESSTIFYDLEVGVVPEPATMLAVLPALGLLARRRKR